MNIRSIYARYFGAITSRRIKAVLLLAVCLIHTAPAGAATIDWLGATSDWASPANWGAGSGPVPGAADIARFQSSAGKVQPSLTAEHSVSGLVFNTSSWTIGGAPNLLHIGAGGISSANSATHTINCDVSVDADQAWWASPGAATLTVGGVVSGTGRVSITGNRVNITNNNVNFTGGMTLNGYAATGGGLVSSHTNSLGTGLLKIFKGWFNGKTIAPTEVWGDFSYAQGAGNADFYGPVTLNGVILPYWSSLDINFRGPVTGPGSLKMDCGAASGLRANNAFDGPLITVYSGGNVTLDGANTLNRDLVCLNGILNVNAAGNSFGKGVKVFAGTLNVASVGSLGTAGVVRVYNGKIVANGTANFGASQPVWLGSTPGGVGFLSLKANALPVIANDSDGLLAIDMTGFNSLSVLPGASYLGLSGAADASFTGSSLTAGSGNTYRLGGGRGDYVLTLDKPSGGNLLTGNNNVVVGRNGFGDNYPGYISLADSNDFSGTITVNRGSTLRGNAQVAGGGSPFGSDANAITLNGGALYLNYGSYSPVNRQPVTNGSLTVNGHGQISLYGYNNATASLSIASLTLPPTNTFAINSGNLGGIERLYVRTDPPTAIPGPLGILDIHYRSANMYFLKYDTTLGFLNHTTEVPIVSAGPNDVAVTTATGYTQTLTNTVYALNIRGGTGYTAISDGGAGTLILASGGFGCPDSSGVMNVNVPIQFGPTGSDVEGVVYTTSNPNYGSRTTLNKDVIGSGGLTKFGPGTLIVKSVTNQHLRLSGRIVVLEGTLESGAVGNTLNDERFPYVTEILLNGGAFSLQNSPALISTPFTIGPNGGVIAQNAGSTGNGVNMNSSFKGEGMLKFTGSNDLNWNGTNNTYSGGTFFGRNGGYLIAATNSTFGPGDVRAAGGTMIFMGQQNIASTARVFQVGSTLEFQYVGTSEIGSLAGSGTINLGPGTGSGGTTLKLGGNNDSTAYYGAIQNKDTTNKRGGGLEKTGSGTLALWGANSYTGATTVAYGTLLVNWRLLGAGGQTVTCNNGATLGGIGRIERPVSISNGGTLAPGDDDVGTLTVSNLYLAASSSTAFEINAVTNDKVVVIGDLTLGGDLAIDPLPGAVIGTHELMTYTGAYATSGTPTVSAPLGFKGTLTVDTTNKRVLLGLTNSSGGTILLFR